MSSSPRATRRSQGPVFGPNLAASSSSSARARSPTDSIPTSASWRVRFRPTPHSDLGGWSSITSAQFSRVSRKTPAGLARGEAVFARSLLSPIPTEHERWVRSLTRRWISAATASGSSVSVSRKASSQPATSSTPGSSRRTAMTRSEASR